MRHHYLRVAWGAAVVALIVQSVRFAPAAQDKAGEAIRQELSEPFCYFMAPTDQIGFKDSARR